MGTYNKKKFLIFHTNIFTIFTIFNKNFKNQHFSPFFNIYQHFPPFWYQILIKFNQKCPWDVEHKFFMFTAELCKYKIFVCCTLCNVQYIIVIISYFCFLQYMFIVYNIFYHLCIEYFVYSQILLVVFFVKLHRINSDWHSLSMHNATTVYSVHLQASINTEVILYRILCIWILYANYQMSRC